MLGEKGLKLFEPDFCGRVGFPDYELTNNNANIRRMKQRLEQVEKLASIVSSEEKIGDVIIRQNADITRTQIIFPDKATALSVKDKLRAHGFVWSPTEGAWQRLLSNSALYHAREIAKGI